MTRLERTYALFGGALSAVLLVGACGEAGLVRLAAAFAVIAGMLFAAILVENSNVA